MARRVMIVRKERGQQPFNRVAGSRRVIGRKSLDVLQDLSLSVKAFFGNVGAIMALLLVTAIAVTHTADKTDGVIHEWARAHPNNGIILWASSNLAKLIGVLAFVPTFMLMRKSAVPTMAIPVTIFIVVMIEEANFYQYCLMSLLLHMFVQSRLATTRIIILSAFAGYVLFVHKTLSQVAAPNILANNLAHSGGSTSPSHASHPTNRMTT